MTAIGSKFPLHTHLKLMEILGGGQAESKIKSKSKTCQPLAE